MEWIWKERDPKPILRTRRLNGKTLGKFFWNVSKRILRDGWVLTKIIQHIGRGGGRNWKWGRTDIYILVKCYAYIVTKRSPFLVPFYHSRFHSYSLFPFLIAIMPIHIIPIPIPYSLFPFTVPRSQFPFPIPHSPFPFPRFYSYSLFPFLTPIIPTSIIPIPYYHFCSHSLFPLPIYFLRQRICVPKCYAYMITKRSPFLVPSSYSRFHSYSLFPFLIAIMPIHIIPIPYSLFPFPVPRSPFLFIFPVPIPHSHYTYFHHSYSLLPFLSPLPVPITCIFSKTKNLCT